MPECVSVPGRWDPRRSAGQPAPWTRLPDPGPANGGESPARKQTAAPITLPPATGSPGRYQRFLASAFAYMRLVVAPRPSGYAQMSGHRRLDRDTPCDAANAFREETETLCSAATGADGSEVLVRRGCSAALTVTYGSRVTTPSPGFGSALTATALYAQAVSSIMPADNMSLLRDEQPGPGSSIHSAGSPPSATIVSPPGSPSKPTSVPAGETLSHWSTPPEEVSPNTCSVHAEGSLNDYTFSLDADPNSSVPPQSRGQLTPGFRTTCASTCLR